MLKSVLLFYHNQLKSKCSKYDKQREKNKGLQILVMCSLHSRSQEYKFILKVLGSITNLKALQKLHEISS